MPANAADLKGNTVVDPDTTNNWSNIAASSDSTENIGRIWTDKSVFNKDYEFSGALNGRSVVKGDADFLVSLSAMSSTSNLRSTTTTTRPLDIVLVLDRSGSMDENIYSYTYSEVYSDNVSENGWTQYFAQTDDGTYVQIERETSWGRFDHWELDGVEVEPKTSAGDNEQNHIQFYTRRSSSMSKMQALKNAAKEFIEMTAEQPNAEQHRIGIVSFSGSSNAQNDDERHANLTYLTGQNVNSLTQTIDNIRSDNGTYPTSALEDAQDMLQNSGRDSQKVVIFFTDGMPGAGSSFNGNVANASINVAHDMKTDDVLVYSIGVLTGADPSADVGNVSDWSNDSSKVNAYLHAISSNYPNATGYTSNRMGNRAPDSDYYFAASDAEELSDVFEKISSSMPTDDPSGSPIEEVTPGGGAENTPGYLTFTDTLGNYMELVGVGEGNNTVYLAFANGIYEGKSTDGGQTWMFSGVVEGGVNSAYPDDVDLSTAITMTVEKSANSLETGDTVTVKIPASLIPLRNYDVDTTAGTMTVSDDTYPVRLFYGASLKAEAKEALNDPTSNDYATIVASQKSEKGDSIDFYSNSYLKNAAEGSTEATFTPNVNNRFYYYPVDTQLFIDESCTEPATQNNIGQYSTLYYKDSYWQLTDDSSDGNIAQEIPITGSITRGSGEWNLKYTNGNVYIAEHTPRSDRPASLVVTKGTDGNLTETASNVLTPMWEGTDVSQHLGNNGKLSFDMPGSLEIKKDVDWGNASDQTKQEKNNFTFNITNANYPTVNEQGENTTEPLTGTYNYYVGDSETASGQVTFNNGSATLTVKGDTTVRIDGLPAGTTFTVTEQGVGQNGWTVTDATSQEGVENTNTADGIVTGTIPAGSQASLTFSNTYHADEVDLSTDTTLKVQKNLEGRDWRDTDEFTFEIDGLGNTAGTDVTTPEPADTTITVNSQTPDHTASFGDITFTMPGEYRYSIVEDNDTNPIAGIDYSGAFYRVVVTVTDNGTGNLEVSNVAIEQRTDDDGVENDPVVAVQGNTVTFVNKYDADGGTTNIDGTKDYTDNVGGNPINADKFTFKIEALGGYDTDNPQTNSYTYSVDEVPLPAGSDETSHSKTVYNTGFNFTFGTIAFDGGDLGRTYEYKVTELAQNKDGQAEAGMTYDKKEYTVKVTVTEVTDDDGTHIVATPDIAPTNLKFTNTYDPADATLTGADAIHGTKTLTGRDMKAGETFYFQLTATNANAQSVLPNAQTVEVTSLTDGSADFNFGDMSFSKVGVYTFTVNEVADENGTETTNGSGMTYDSNICTVTVDVTDNKQGALVADVTYSNNVNSSVTDKAQFNNTYKASMNYGAEGAGGINVTKQMLDRPMANNEFSFTIEGVESADNSVSADEANAKLTEADKNFQNTAAAENDTATMEKLQSMSFNQDDAGKTFSYLVSETIPADGDKLAAVAYDQSQYRVDIEVVDNGNGTMHTVTTVTKAKASDGTAASEVVVDHANSDAGDYAAPTFGFVNDYNPTPAIVAEGASHQIQVTKQVTGADSATDYTFTLTATGDNIGNIEGLDQKNQLTVSTDGTIKNGDSQTKTFGELTFNEPGTYTFTVQENQPTADAGWTFDDADGDGTTDTHDVTVYVTDRNEDGQYDGSLYIDNVTGSPVEITNSYSADPVIVGGDGAQQQITVQKTVTGNSTNTDFNFKIEPVDPGNDKWKNVEAVDEDFDALTSITDDFSDGNSKTATFGGIQFNATGEYQFNITEVEANDETSDPAGWTYDTGTAKVTVKVADNGEGKLVAEVVYSDKGEDTNGDSVADAATFTNSYSASGSLDGDADGNLTVTKNYTSNLGSPWAPGDSFSFVLAADMTDAETQTAVNNGWIELPETTEISIDDKTTDYKKSFDNIKFTHAGTYKFTVHEALPDGVTADSPTKDGVTYDTSTKTVKVNVTDNNDGTLTATVAEGSDKLTFNNAYNVQPAMFRAAYFALQGNKVLDGRNWEQGDTFTFTMTAGRGTNPDGTQMAAGVVEDTMPDKTTDTIEPLASDGSWVNNNSAQFTFTDERYPGGGVVPDADDVFTFTQPGTYRYLIAETNPNASNPGSGILGVTYDQTQYRLTVEVKDDGNGNLVVESSKFSSRPTAGSGEWTDIASDQGITFTNTYSTEQVGVSFNVAKVLTGRDTPMTDNEFMFHMEFAGWMTNADFDAQSTNWSMDGDVAANAPKAAADKGNIIRGDAVFDNMHFTSGNVGYTYRYAVTEIIPNDATNPAYEGVTYGTASAEQKAASGWVKNGVTYDSSTKYLTAKVTSEQTEDQQNPGTYIEVVRVATGGEAPYNEQTGQFEGDAIFTNTYDAGSTTVDTTGATARLTKVLEGRDWADDETFSFTVTADDQAWNDTLPANTTVEVAKPKSGNSATFDFGPFTFDEAGTYTYTVKENAGTAGGMAYSTNEAKITITVTDNNNGGYTTGVTIANSTFTNTYKSELDYNDAGAGISIVKTLVGHEMTEFSFTVTPGDADSAAKLGIGEAGETLTVKSGTTSADGLSSVGSVAVLDGNGELMFNQGDEGKEYIYTVQEVKPDPVPAGYTYDDTVYTVTVTTEDDGQGGIKVYTNVKANDGSFDKTFTYDNDDATENETAYIPFENSYNVTGELGGQGTTSIVATKTLTNRPMVDGEFDFSVVNVNDQTKTPIATGTNDDAGNVTFTGISYSTQQMIADVQSGLADSGTEPNTYVYTYEVSEDQASFDDGVTAIAGSFQITVTVTDNGDGTLSFAVGYPDGGTSLQFRNAYGEEQQGQVTLNVNGSKVYDKAPGTANAPDIAGKFTFELTGSDGAPMPATTQATNDAAGNVNFGDIVYTMENVFGDTGSQDAATNAEDAENAEDLGNDEEAVDSEASGESDAVSNEADVDAQSAQRTKTFTYTVTESGSVEGVDNDQNATKTFTVTVTDNGDGSLSVKSNPAQGALFSFTNTYNVDPEESSPTGEGGITITKNLDGRNLNDGEFTFELVDQNDTVVATGTNDANGNVELGKVKFTEPGNFTYTIREAKGSLGGVDYDAVQYKATATVTDNGNGTLKVEWSFTDAQGNPLGESANITFNNTYTAQPTSVSLGTGKLIEGRALAAGEFTFKLTDADGNEVGTATNEENGAVTFDTITYDTPGDYTYTITEVAPQDTDPFTDGIQNNGVTYDESVYNATVKVTDNGKGNLTAQISYSTEDGTAPLFVNTYTAPAEPEQGTDDGGLFGMAKTGDFMGGMMAVIAAVIAAAAGGAAYAVRKMRRPRGRHAR